MPELDLATAIAESFEKLVGQEFSLQLGEDSVGLCLDNIKIFETAGKRSHAVVTEELNIPPRQPFALTWVGPLEPEIPAGSYTISNDNVGEMFLFVSPFGREPAAMLYESVFS